MSPAADSQAPTDNRELELSFPPKPEYVRMARHTVAALARMHDVADDIVEDLKLAVSEACTNAVSVNATSGEPVHVLAGLADDSLVVDVLDAGPGIDPGLIEAEPELDSEEFTFEKGLSLPLLHGLVDEMEVLPRAPKGSVLRMRLSMGEPQERS